MSRRFRLALAALCALAACAACLLYGERIKAQEERARLDVLERYGGEVVSLLVATRNLEYGDIIDAGAIATREWLADLAPDQALVRLEDVIGRQVTVPLAKGLPLTQLNLRDGTSGLDVPAGFVALSLSLTDKLGLSRNISAGTRVIAYSVGSNSTVLLTGDALILASPIEATTFSSTQTISLAVRPEDVSAVLGASARGDLRLVIPADDVEFAHDAPESAPVDVPAEDGAVEDRTSAQGESLGGDAQKAPNPSSEPAPSREMPKESEE